MRNGRPCTPVIFFKKPTFFASSEVDAVFPGGWRFIAVASFQVRKGCQLGADLRPQHRAQDGGFGPAAGNGYFTLSSNFKKIFSRRGIVSTSGSVIAFLQKRSVGAFWGLLARHWRNPNLMCLFWSWLVFQGRLFTYLSALFWFSQDSVFFCAFVWRDSFCPADVSGSVSTCCCAWVF